MSIKHAILLKLILNLSEAQLKCGALVIVVVYAGEHNFTKYIQSMLSF